MPTSGVGPPAAYILSTYVTGNTFEPFGQGGVDVTGASYTDTNFWHFCGEGATTVVLGYWSPQKAINGYGQATFKDPSNGLYTTWNDTYNRSYLMYLAIITRPPSFGSPGEYAFSAGTTYTTDIRDTLNWEASDENSSTWSNYYYGIAWASSLSSSDLMADIQADIGSDGKADVVAVNTHYLPNWPSSSAAGHYVAIVGYNTYNNTLTYVDTCGSACGSNGNGVYTISLAALSNAIQYDNGDGALIW